MFNKLPCDIDATAPLVFRPHFEWEGARPHSMSLGCVFYELSACAGGITLKDSPTLAVCREAKVTPCGLLSTNLAGATRSFQNSWKNEQMEYIFKILPKNHFFRSNFLYG